MWSSLSLALGAMMALQSREPPGRAPALADARQLFQSLDGRWSCTGAFASGAPLRSTIEFRRIFGGNGVAVHHRDLPPSTYIADATWSFDSASGRLVSLAWAGKQTSAGRAPGLYASEQWSASSATLVQQPLLAPPWAPNRFRYRFDRSNLSITWELQHNGQWTMGDRLECTRS